MDRLKRINIYNILGIMVLMLFVLPIILTFMLSVMGKTQIGWISHLIESANGLQVKDLILKGVSLRQYFIVLLNKPEFLEYYWNSLKITLPIVAGQTVLGTAAAYGFSKFEFKGRDKLFTMFIVTMLIPFQVTLVPNFIIALKTGTYGSFSAIYLPGMFNAFAVFYMRQYLKEIPDEIIEAARVDGASELTILAKIVVPIAKPFIYSLTVLSFIDAWNLVEQPLIMLDVKSMQPLSLILANMGKGDFEIAFGASILYLIPCVLLYIGSRKDIESGLKHLSLK